MRNTDTEMQQSQRKSGEEPVVKEAHAPLHVGLMPRGTIGESSCKRARLAPLTRANESAILATKVRADAATRKPINNSVRRSLVRRTPVPSGGGGSRVLPSPNPTLESEACLPTAGWLYEQ